MALLYYVLCVSLFPLISASPTSLSVIINNVEVPFVNKSLIDFHLDFRPINSTYRLLFGNATIFVPLIKDVSYIGVKIYKLLKNEYRAIPMNYKFIASEALDKYNTFEVQDILKKHISPPVSWPVKVRVLYRVFDVNLSYEKIPPLIPAGEYKSIVEYCLDKQRKMVQLNFYFKVISSV